MLEGGFQANEKLAELRDILYMGDPSPGTWVALCAALDGWPTDDSLQVAFDYIQEHLDTWDDALREAPRRWWEVVRRGGQEPRFSLARRLSLAAFGEGTTAAAALLREPFMERLTILNLSHNRLTPAEARQLASSPHLRSLRVLDLGLNALGDKGMEALVEASFVPQLRVLDLTRNEIEDRGIGALAALPESALEALVLWGNPIGSVGAERLAASEGLCGLRELRMGSNRVGDEGASALAHSPLIKELRVLDLTNNHIGEFGISQLLWSPGLDQMERLDLRGNPGCATVKKNEHGRDLGSTTVLL